MKEARTDSERYNSSITIKFNGDLPQLLVKRERGRHVVTYLLSRRTSIKDICESLGIPHPEIDTIRSNSHEIGFDYIVSAGDHIEVSPISAKTDFSAASTLRPFPLTRFRFIADVNVGKLARWLRLLGFDTLYENNYGDDELAQLAGDSGRILLTKDCNLLKRKKILFGHLIRKDDPESQIVEVVTLFNLQGRIQPYSRCLRCNGILSEVQKAKIDHLLEPLTRKYFESFHQCGQCGQVYWHGSHRSKMEKDLQAVLLKCRAGE